MKSCQSRMMLNTFKCDKCSKQFAHETNMHRHKRRAHGAEENS